jgi:hypothetical protein
MEKRRKSYSFDAVMRFFLQHYNIPTRQDIEKLGKRIDRLEKTLRASQWGGRKGVAAKRSIKKGPAQRGRAKMTATEKVLSVMRRSSQGVDVARLKTRTGFEDKKIRNIIFRLSKQGTIKRAGRGVYVIQ